MYRQETVRLHLMTRSRAFRLVITVHAAEQMEGRDIARFEIERVLRAGPVVMVEQDPDGRERWRVAGHADGRRIEVVIEPRPPTMVVLITVIRVG